MTDDPFWMNPKKIKLSDGTEVILRPEVKSDLEPTWIMFSSLSNATLEFLPIEFTRERVEGWFNDIDYTKIIPILGVVKNGDCIKVIASATLRLPQIDVYNHKAEFGITVHDDYHGRGLGKALTKYMLGIAVELGLKKVELSVVSHNERAIHIYEQYGFEKEGLIRMDHFNKVLRKYCDVYKMGKILD